MDRDRPRHDALNGGIDPTTVPVALLVRYLWRATPVPYHVTRVTSPIGRLTSDDVAADCPVHPRWSRCAG